MRALFYLASLPTTQHHYLSQAQELDTWNDVLEMLQPVMDACNAKVDAARLLENTRHDEARVRAFYEEKCGFVDFMCTPDKAITAAVLCYVKELQHLVTHEEWGLALAKAVTDHDRVRVMGHESFAVYKSIENAIL
uniref:Uncharacterized protein n=1 Tax=Lygus hesperus TaxID=30085 RepID=A0A146L315_LYGHE